MTLEKWIKTSKREIVDIISDDDKVIAHFANTSNFADVVLNQFNGDRLYDSFFEGKDNLTILDIGGNIGLFSLYAQDRAKAIYPIEPTPSHFYILTELTKNYKNIHPLNLALNNKNTTIDFYINEENSTMNSLVNQYGVKTPVKAKTLASIIKQLKLKHVDFIKCDIEGGEMVALTDKTVGEVKDKVDAWFLEIHNTSKEQWPGNLSENKNSLKNIFENAGYAIQDLNFDSLYAFK